MTRDTCPGCPEPAHCQPDRSGPDLLSQVRARCRVRAGAPPGHARRTQPVYAVMRIDTRSPGTSTPSLTPYRGRVGGEPARPLLVEAGEVGRVGEQHTDLDDVVETGARRPQDRLAVGERLPGLLLDGLSRHAPGARVDADGAGHEDERPRRDRLAEERRAGCVRGGDDLAWHGVLLGVTAPRPRDLSVQHASCACPSVPPTGQPSSAFHISSCGRVTSGASPTSYG